MVTIDESGKVSKVEMTYNEKELNDYFERDEYNYCVESIYNSLKIMQFDILKDKGVPTSERIFIEIWFDKNGKLENWTK